MVNNTAEAIFLIGSEKIKAKKNRREETNTAFACFQQKTFNDVTALIEAQPRA